MCVIRIMHGSFFSCFLTVRLTGFKVPSNLQTLTVVRLQYICQRWVYENLSENSEKVLVVSGYF